MPRYKVEVYYQENPRQPADLPAESTMITALTNDAAVAEAQKIASRQQARHFRIWLVAALAAESLIHTSSIS